jgi:hypothetical protein
VLNATVSIARTCLVRTTTNSIATLFGGLTTALLLSSNGCSKSAGDGASAAAPLKPKEAASQLQQAFVSADVAVKNNANIASEALRTADYEKAIQSLQTIKARQNLSFDQGLAVHNSMVALESKLISAMNAGDANAKRAYELLKQSRRN